MNTTDLALITEAESRIRKVKLQLMLETNTVFFCSLLANLKLIITNNVPTAATDGIRLLMNPQFCVEQGAPELLGLTLHEVMHCAFQHMSRQAMFGLDPKIWNMAADFYINLYLKNLGYSLPPTECLDRKYSGWSTRQIYDDLIQNPPPDDDYTMDILILGVGDKDQEGNTLSQGDIDELNEQAITNVTKAVMQADIAGNPGSVPGDIRTLLEARLNPKLPWEAIFQNHMSKHAKDDYDWSRPNKKYMPAFYLPRMKSDALDEILFTRDCSGSMELTWLNSITSEMRYVWDMLQPLKMRVMDFDTEVHRDVVHTLGDQFDSCEVFGGGGTDITPCIEAIRQDSPAITVIFTDGCFHMPDMTNLHTDLVWVIVNNPSWTTPYGTVIHFEV